jgi:hypothetical protein
MEAPKHAFEVKISIGANTVGFIEEALEELLRTVRHGGGVMMSAGYNGSFSMHVEKRDITPEQYRAELEEWRRGQ